MIQYKKQTKNEFSDILEEFDYKYEFSNFDNDRCSDTYRSGDSSFMVVYCLNPLTKKHPNIIISDACLGTLQYDSLLPDTNNVVFQGRIKKLDELKFILKICMRW